MTPGNGPHTETQTATAGADAPAVVHLPAPALAVRNLRLTNFRSYASAELKVSGRPVVLAGANGAGKTNVLDAISLLAPGRGLRGSKLAEHTRRGPTVTDGARWAVSAAVMREEMSFDIGTGLMLGPNGGEKRVVRLNGAPAASSADLGEIIQMVWLTPSMDRLFTEGASGRRKFLDRLTLGFDATHARMAARYETAMRERARLLKYGPRDPAWLDGLEATMAETGVAMARARAHAVTRLNVMLTTRGDAGSFPAAALTLEGECDRAIDTAGDNAPDMMRKRLAGNRINDAESGRTVFGPHLSDLSVRHTLKRAEARACSTGEQKALLISIVLADAWELSARHERPAPVLLLDEIAAHLDRDRRKALFDEVLALGAQAWITGTDMALFEDLAPDADVFMVENSRFTAA